MHNGRLHLRIEERPAGDDVIEICSRERRSDAGIIRGAATAATTAPTDDR